MNNKSKIILLFLALSFHRGAHGFLALLRPFTVNRLETVCRWMFEKLQQSGKPSYATTFFYKQDGTKLTPEEQDVCYEAMLHNEFPMAPFYNHIYNPDVDETEAIQEAISQTGKCKKVKAAFIPTTAYQLLHALLFEKGKEEWKGFAVASANIEDFIVYNKLSKIVDEFWQFNNFLIDFLKTKNINCENGLSQSNLEALISDLWDNHEKYIAVDFVSGSRNLKRVYIDKLSKNVVIKAIGAEYASKQDGISFLLYRGNSKWSFPEFSEYNHNDFALYQDGHINDTLKKFESVSVSYGASLFSGLYFDQSACAGYLMQGDGPEKRSSEYYVRNLGYMLAINKKRLLHDQDSIESLFVIPPITPLVGLYSSGEFFHPRTKLTIDYDAITEDTKIRGLFKYSKTLKTFKDIPLFYFKSGDSHILRKLLVFIIKHAIPLTDDTQEDLQKLRQR